MVEPIAVYSSLPKSKGLEKVQIGSEWGIYSSGDNFHESYIRTKRSFNSSLSNSIENTTSFLEEPISLLELNSCLKKLKALLLGSTA